MFKHKEHQPKLLRSNVVYKLTCSCDSVYIGQTRRNLRARLNDHNPAANSNQQSDVAKHFVAILSKGKEKLFLLLPFFHHFVIFFR